MFHCAVRFNESVNRMTLEKEVADMWLPSGDPLLSEILDHYGQSLLKHPRKTTSWVTFGRFLQSDFREATFGSATARNWRSAAARFNANSMSRHLLQMN